MSGYFSSQIRIFLNYESLLKSEATSLTKATTPSSLDCTANGCLMFIESKWCLHISNVYHCLKPLVPETTFMICALVEMRYSCQYMSFQHGVMPFAFLYKDKQGKWGCHQCLNNNEWEPQTKLDVLNAIQQPSSVIFIYFQTTMYHLATLQ